MSQPTTVPNAGRSPFVQGLRDIVPVMIATLPFGMVFGALAVKTNLSTGEAVLMSGALYAGASQFVALQFWADPLPYWTILLSVLAVNLRHVLYSAALGRKMTHWTPAERYLGFALLVDPTFALADLNSGPKLSPAYYWGLAVPLYVNWVLATWVGAVFGSLIEHPETYGIDFVVTAYFIHLVAGFRRRPNALAVIAVSAAGSLLAYLTLGPPWHFAGGAAAGMCVAAAMGAPAGGPGVSGGLEAVGLILLLGVGTYLTRAGGHVVLSRFEPLNPRVEAALDAVPVAVMTAIVAPLALASGWADAIAAAATVAASLRLSMHVTLVIGVALVALLRVAGL